MANAAEGRAPIQPSTIYDFVIVGSGFGGSVSALRLAEKGYDVLVLERGRRFSDDDFAQSDWDVRKHLWIPSLGCFGIWENTLLNGIMILHGCGVGGGSLVYANVLMKPDDRLFAAPAWRRLADWKAVLEPHYETARRMLGVTAAPVLWPADEALAEAAAELGCGRSFRQTEVGVFFNEKNPGGPVADPYFGGEGPDRNGCTHCGGCMIGCRENAKNTLVKNYLYLAEKRGVTVRPEATVTDIHPFASPEKDGARYEVLVRPTAGSCRKPPPRVRTRNVIVSAGAVNTNRLLFRCRDVTRSLPKISSVLGTNIRTNSESLTGMTARDDRRDYSRGVAIGSIFSADADTRMEAVRFPDGSGATTALLAAPMVDERLPTMARFLQTLRLIAAHPVDFLALRFSKKSARRTVIFLTMQTKDNLMRLRLGRNLFTLFRRDLVCEKDETAPVRADVAIANRATRMLAEKTGGTAQGMVNQSLLNIPGTAHFMGGVPFGRTSREGVIGLDFEVHHYPGLYVVDGSVMPANPGVNPSLTIAALAEHAMAQMPPKPGAAVRPPVAAGENRPEPKG